MAMEAPSLTLEEEQEKWLAEAKRAVRNNAAYMQQAINSSNLQEVLKYASSMLAELKTSSLSPQNYYELYIQVLDELQKLEFFFEDEVSNGRKVEELYEIVQHAGNIVPRLYLLITVGSVYIKSKEAPAKDILNDLVEMCKGVQHPTRGLFLRHYLSTMTKSKLPDTGNQYEGEGGTVQDSVDFVLQNFKEMVWLWVRMEQKQIIADPVRRAKERKALCVLVGFNLTRLGNLEGIDLDMYVDVVMPRVLEIITNSKDKIAQQYLAEITIQVFPDEFHLVKIESLLKTFATDLLQEVNLQPVFTSLMDRLASYAEECKESTEKRRKWETKALASMFELFKNSIQQIVDERPGNLGPQEYVQTQLSLLNLVLKAYPEDFDRANEVFRTTANQLKNLEGSVPVPLIKEMLTRPLKHYGNMASVLDLTEWPELLEILAIAPRREVARDLCTYALKFGEPLRTVEHVQKVFKFIEPLVIDADDASKYSDEDDFEDDQILVAKLLHLFQGESHEVQFKMYSATRKQFGQGGEDRVRYLLPPLAFSFLRLALRVKKAVAKGEEVNVKVKKIFQYVGGILEVLSKKFPELALNVYLQAARTAERCEESECCNDLLTPAFLLYEEEISSQSKLQIQVLPNMIATVQALDRLDDEYLETFCQKLCSYTSKLLRKPDQCRVAILCSHLFERPKWEENRKNVLECLRKSLKYVDGCGTADQTPLFVDILNKYLYFFTMRNEHITANNINVLINLVEEKADDEEGEGDLAPAKVYFSNTITHIKIKQRDDEDSARWQEIVVDKH